MRAQLRQIVEALAQQRQVQLVDAQAAEQIDTISAARANGRTANGSDVGDSNTVQAITRRVNTDRARR